MSKPVAFRRGATLLLPALLSALFLPLVDAQVLSFSPQSADRNVTLWAVTACGGRPIPASEVYRAAGEHGLVWLLPAAAAQRASQKSFWSRAVRWGGLAAAAASGFLTLDVVRANAQVQQAVGSGAAFLNILLPLAQKNVDPVDNTAGGPLAMGPDGCGTGLYYAETTAAPQHAFTVAVNDTPAASAPLAKAHYEFAPDLFQQMTR